MKLVQFFIQRSFVVNLITGFLILSGIFVLTSMKRDLIPPFQWNLVKVRVYLPGATPEEMEKHVTFPIEEAIKGSPGVEKMESRSSLGSTTIDLYYQSGYKDITEAPNQIESKINSLRSRLPSGIRSVVVERQQVNDVFLFYLGFKGFDQEDSVHRVFYRNFVKAVNNVDGVILVREGLKKRDIYLEVSPEKLQFYGLNISEVQSAVRRALDFAPIGQTEIGEKKFAVKIEKMASTTDEIREIPIRSSLYGKTVRLGDVANVRYKNEDTLSKNWVNGEPSTYAVIRKDTSSDAIDLKPKVEKIISQFNETAPKGVEIVNLVDGPHFIQQQLEVLKSNGLVGFVLVFLILMLFLNWRTAVMTCIGLPVAYAGSLIVLYWMGVKIDLLSIIGMILVIGILVDDAIIVAEKYVDNLSKGLAPNDAALTAVRELIVPVTGTVLTTIVAFAPLMLIESEWSVILFAVPLVVISALAMSYLESFFVLPNHLAHFVKKAPTNRIDSFVARARRGYEYLLTGTLRFRYPVFILVLALMGVSGWIGATKIKHDFQLRVNSEKVVVYAVLKESSSLDETYQSVKSIEDYLISLKTEHVENVITGVGSTWMNGKMHNGFRYAKIQAFLDRDYPYPSKIKKEMKSVIEEQIEKMKSERFDKLYVNIERQDGEQEKNSMVSVKITGAEDVDFREIESAIEGAALKQASIKEYAEDTERYQQSWVFVPELEKLNRYNIDQQQLARKVRSYFTADEIIETRIAGENVFVYSEFDISDKLAFDQLPDLVVNSSKGLPISLSLLGSWKKEKSLQSISHYDGQRHLSMDFKINKDANTSVAKSELRSALSEIRGNFPTYQIEVVDADESEAKAQVWALKVAVICITAVFLVIALILGSLTQPLIVGLPIPFGLIGIVLALYFHELPLGIMALVGLIGTVGVAVNASIVMVDQINGMAKGIQGRVPRSIFVKGASSRLRAIMLTTFTTLGGVFPMAYSLGGESGFTQPLAFSMGWGLSFATILTLFLLPALLEIREDFLSIGRWVLQKVFGAASPTPVSDLAPSDAAVWQEISKVENPSSPEESVGREPLESPKNDSPHS